MTNREKILRDLCNCDISDILVYIAQMEECVFPDTPTEKGEPMKKYNAKLIRDFVEANKIEIKTVHLGMKEDWRWTNDLLYDADNGGYQFDLGKRDIMVQGITGSSWATPVMLVRFVDGMKLVAPCYYEDGRKFSSAHIAMCMYGAKMTGGMDDVLEGLTDEQ